MMSPVLLSALLLIPLLPELLVNAREAGDTNYKYNISGTLYCFNPANNRPEPMKNILIALWEKDAWFNDFEHDHLGETIVKAGEFFNLTGSEDEGHEPTPYIYFEHHCHCPDRRRLPIYATYVWLKPEPEEQELSIHLGQNERAVMRVNGKGEDDAQLEMETGVLF